MPRLRALSLLIFVVLMLCSAAATTAGAVPSTQGPSDAAYRRLCRAIRPQHVRALFRTATTAIRLGGDADCAFSPRGTNPELVGVEVFLRIDDGDRTLWAHRGDRFYGRFRWLSRTGRLAKWGYLGGRLPSVVDARRGSFTCTLIPVGISGLAVPAGATLDAARAYVRRLLALCDDVYAAHG